MKKRKLLETLKELIETNAQLSAQNEELQALVGKEAEQPTETPAAEQPQIADKDFEKLEADNRILSQELIEAKAQILKLTKQLEKASEPISEAIKEEASTDKELAEDKVEEVALKDDADEAVNTEERDDVADLFIGISLNIDENTQPSEIDEIDFVVKPIIINNDGETFNDSEDVLNTKAINEPEAPATDSIADINDWQIDMASQYIGKAIIMITEFNNEIADSTSENKQDLITLALGKSEGFKAEIVDAISACSTPEAAEATAEKRIDELKRYINALRLSL